MGVVYKAKDTHLDRFVALKLLPAEKVADPERKRRFIQEARAASALNHPNIITIYAIDQQDGADFIAMEYVAGKTLHELIGRKGLKLVETLKCAVQVADALAAAHAGGIVHRDLKPANIMVTEKGLVKVLDFGLAKLTEADSGCESETLSVKDAPRTEEGAILGTVAYMSPEQAEGRKVDARSDIFSFGSVLYEMITGQRAFRGETRLSTQSAILKEEPQAISSIVQDSPRELERIVARCLRKDPDRRFQHMDDVKIALEELKEESDSGKLATAQLGAKPRQPSRWVRTGSVVLGLALIGTGIWLRLFQPGATGGPPPRVVPLTSYPGREMQPALSPDGKQVAFAWNGEKEDNYDIYVKLVDAGTPLRLTTALADDLSPAWSPDGRYIAFRRSLPDGDGIFIIPALGGAERKLAQLVPGASAGLDWSRDGNFLAIVDEIAPSTPSCIFLLSLETGDTRQITWPPQASLGDSSPAFSPDGRYLAFARRRSSAVSVMDVYVARLNSGEWRRLTFDDRSIAGLAWTPDSREVIFSSSRAGRLSLWRVSVSGGAPIRVAGAGGRASRPSVARQGNRLAYAESYSDTNIWRIQMPGPGSGDEAGRVTQPEKLIASTWEDSQPQYSLDGKKITFTSEASGSYEIWACDSDGSNRIQLTSFGGPLAGSSRWSPDGRRIAFDSRREGSTDIYVVDAQGGTPRRITTETSDEVRPSWSRDGRWIYFGSDRTQGWQVWKVPAQGGQAVQVTRKGGYEAFESPDGKTLYYIKSRTDRGIWAVPTEGGKETQVLREGDQSHWSLNEHGIYFMAQEPTGVVIRFFHFATKQERQIAVVGKAASPGLGFCVSPDGRQALYEQVDQVVSDLMLVENFR
jgi:Tol biopolymer transport system component